jgi:hypothetical protein
MLNTLKHDKSLRHASAILMSPMIVTYPEQLV